MKLTTLYPQDPWASFISESSFPSGIWEDQSSFAENHAITSSEADILKKSAHAPRDPPQAPSAAIKLGSNLSMLQGDKFTP